MSNHEYINDSIRIRAERLRDDLTLYHLEIQTPSGDWERETASRDPEIVRNFGHHFARKGGAKI